MFGKKSKASNEHRIEWEAIRRNGKVYYILTRGILAAFIYGALAFFIYDVCIQHKPLGSFDRFMADKSLGWLIAGLFTGYREWESNEKLYRSEMTEGIEKNCYSPEQTLAELQRGMINGNSN